MTEKKLYALTDEDVNTLKDALHGPLIGMTFTGGPQVARIAHAANALTPLDRDAAVKWMAEAMIAESPYSDFITEDEREWYMLDARAALAALLGGEK